MAIDLKKFIGRFVEEAREHLRQIQGGLPILEAGDQTALHAIFRSAHTIKGSARLLKLEPVTAIAHRVEDVMALLRDGTLGCSPELGALLQQAMDALSGMVDRLAETGDGSALSSPDPALLAALEAVVTQHSTELTSAVTAPALPSPSPAPSLAPPTPPPRENTGSNAPRLQQSETVRVRLGKLDELIKLMGELVSSHARMRQRLVEIDLIDHRMATDADHPAAMDVHRFVQQLREDVLDQESLMAELHDKTLMMRMLPLAIVFEPAERLVRDLARSVGKQAICVVHGAEIELDRRIIDKLADPIIHLIRNAIDHGLESVDARQTAGKPAQGRLTLAARQESGWVVIEVSDDGAGIPLDGVRRRGVQMGLIAEEKAATLTERETLDLIFLPGFSTNTLVTDLSGRGVGMDVVRQTIVEDLRGGIEVSTRSGHGSTFALRLPLSLAVMRVLLVETTGMTFGFTAQYVSELKRVPAEAALTLAGREVIIVGNEFVPLVALSTLLDLPGPPARPFGRASILAAGLLTVIVVARNEKLALVVDALLDEHDMVIHPLPELIRKMPLVAGLVVTGSNALVSVLHPPALLERARRLRGEPAHPAMSDPEPMRHDRVLVVDDSLNTREIEKDVLEACGFRVTLAEDGPDGLRQAMEGEFDAVLTDVEMPGMDGFTLTERLRSEEKYRNKPIVILTSREREEDKRRGLKVGADAYLVKGDFSQGNLVDTLRQLLGWRGHTQ
ncbi:MAG: response regulator [Magnetococcales bacterium]|nr:response regulator [Magnetococcales bacterium]